MTRALVLLLALGASTVQAAEGSARFAWLSGCWAPPQGEPGTGEQWMAPAGGSLFGMSRTVRQGRTVEFEFLQIREVDGNWVFIAQPNGRPPTSFPLKSASDTALVFENTGHDFPQRIIYRKDGPDMLQARIEGMRNGSLKGIDFPLRRQPCPPQ